MRFFKLLIVVSHLSFFISMSQSADSDKKSTNKSIDSLTENFKELKGLITVYKNKEEVYFEIDDSLLNRDLLMVTRIVKSPSDFQAYKNAGSKTSEQLIQFIKKKEKHSIENTGNSRLEIVEIQSGLKLIEEDIVRLHDIYGRK